MGSAKKTPPPPPPTNPAPPTTRPTEPKPDLAITCSKCGLRSISRFIVAPSGTCKNAIACAGRQTRNARRQEAT